MMLLYVWSVLQSSWSSSRCRNLFQACRSFSSHSCDSLTGPGERPQWCCWDWGWCWRVAWPSRSSSPSTWEHLPGGRVPVYVLGPRERVAGLVEGVLNWTLAPFPLLDYGGELSWAHPLGFQLQCLHWHRQQEGGGLTVSKGGRGNDFSRNILMGISWGRLCMTSTTRSGWWNAWPSWTVWVLDLCWTVSMGGCKTCKRELSISRWKQIYSGMINPVSVCNILYTFCFFLHK